MCNKNNLPSDFNLFLTSHALLGVLEAIYELTAEIPEKEPALSRWMDSVTGLAWAGLKAARETNDFLRHASDKHRFPKSYDDLESEDGTRGVRETPALYAVNG